MNAGTGLDRAVSGRSFPARFLGALRLDATVFEEVGHDAGALPQAAAVVAIAGLARGIQVLQEQGWVGAVASGLAAFVMWFAVATAVTVIGVRIFHGTSNFGELLRTLGFAGAPLVVLPFCALPLGTISAALSTLVHAVAVGALVLAVRQALDTNTTRALIVCAGAIGLGLALLFLLGILLMGRPLT
ncbi:MAG TPA: YIP1 family protein [Myxococcota bacterium]|nr:YIP1 family protein [Myxococcota bacterium]